MTEQKIAMLAIRYLAQIGEAISEVLQSGRAENETSAAHCISWCFKHIHTIAMNSCENQDQQRRFWSIRDAMDWLITLREQQVATLSHSGRPVPSVEDLRVVRLAIMGAASQ